MDRNAGVLARLREERARLAGELAGLDRAIAALEAATEERALVVARPTPEPELVPESPSALAAPLPESPPGPYKHLGLYDAIALYLREAGEPKTVREIAEALLAGGYRTGSGNFASVIRAMLGKPDRPLGICQIKGGYRWYVQTPDSATTA